MTEEQICELAKDKALDIQKYIIDGNIDIDSFAKDCCLAGAHSRDEEMAYLTYRLNDATEKLQTVIAERDNLRNPWINVEERLPEERQLVFVQENNGSISLPQVAYIGSISDIYGKISWIEINGSRMTCDVGNVTHWIPVPKLKKDESSEK